MLYVVGTPIGNLQDLSERQASVIASSPIILAENTSSAGILLQYIQSKHPLHSEQRVVHYSKDTEFARLPEVLDLL